ncbi:NADP-dependent oxidoreductase domain-containing protein [Mycena sp. CBHHK59/15]|nr:NADP-dependent oxidoreductase domain-containing protein [Mycena sp. CBHHK59/15]
MSPLYPTRQLGRNVPMVSAIGVGTMGLGGAFYGSADEDSVLGMLSHVADSGITFWDTADVYGASEAIIGKWFKTTGRRGEIFLSTKFGAKDPTENAENIWRPTKQLQASLALLDPNPDDAGEVKPHKIHIDLYFQHRVDPDVPIERKNIPLRPFTETGEIGYLGLSDCGIDVLRPKPFLAREIGVGIILYSPLGRDFEATDVCLFMPRFDEANFAANLKLVRNFESLAVKYSATSTQIALSWILAAYPDFVPIPGMQDAVRIQENAMAAQIALFQDDLRAIGQAVRNEYARGTRLPTGFTSSACSAKVEPIFLDPSSMSRIGLYFVFWPLESPLE